MKLWFALLAITCCAACGKNQDSPLVADPDLPAGTIEYKYQDSLIVFRDGDPLPANAAAVQNVKVYKEQPQPGVPVRYYFAADKGDFTAFSFSLWTDSAAAKVYVYDSKSTRQLLGTASFAIPAFVSSFDADKDYFKVTITSYHDGKISGLFEGRMSNILQFGNEEPPAVTTITEGKFRDITVVYN